MKNNQKMSEKKHPKDIQKGQSHGKMWEVCNVCQVAVSKGHCHVLSLKESQKLQPAPGAPRANLRKPTCSVLKHYWNHLKPLVWRCAQAAPGWPQAAPYLSSASKGCFRPSAWDFHLAVVQCLGRHLISLHNSNTIVIISYNIIISSYHISLYLQCVYIHTVLSNSVCLDRVSCPTCCSTGAQLPELEPASATSGVIALGKQAARTCQAKYVDTRRVDFFWDMIFIDFLRSSVCFQRLDLTSSLNFWHPFPARICL